MFKKRLLTTMVLLPGLIWLIFFASKYQFLFVTSFIVIFAQIEWIKLLQLNRSQQILVFSSCAGLFSGLVWYLFFCSSLSLSKGNFIYFIVKSSSCFWLIILIYIILYTKLKKLKNSYFSKLINKAIAFSYLFFGIFSAWIIINYLKVINRNLLILSTGIIIITDVAGYIFGKKFGKHQVTSISPKKTWEGLIGGYLGITLFCLGYFAFVGSHYPVVLVTTRSIKLNTLIVLFLLSNVTYLFAVIGDLLESFLKRIVDLKDSGSILPGHGGILDRIDSFCAGMPIFVLGVVFFGL